MLNINQNFDLKAPVFNFDRDYFNSVKELNAYDTSNVPNHFITNVGGILYLFTNGKWLPMISTLIKYDGSAAIKLANLNIIFGAKNGDIPYMNMREYSQINGNNESVDAYVSPKNISIETLSSYLDKNLISLSLVDDQYRKTKSTINIKDTYSPDETTEDSNFLLQADSAKMTSTIKNYGTGTISFNANTTMASELILKKGRDNAASDEFEQITINTSNGISVQDVGNSGILNSNEVRFGDSTESAKLFKSGDSYCLLLGSPDLFKIIALHTYPGADITGVQSITACNDPSATKVWATDGSTVDLTTKANVADLSTKANTSDVLLKKSASGGYYIESNNNELGNLAFVANSSCKASGTYSHSEGERTEAKASSAHSEGYNTSALGKCCHAEGMSTNAYGAGSHSEGVNTISSGKGSHALGMYNINNINAIHSVGIGYYDRDLDTNINQNAEYIYVKYNEAGSDIIYNPKNGYKYLIGVGGYDGISTDNTTYKSVQEVIADLTARIEQLETKVRALEAANTPA